MKKRLFFAGVLFILSLPLFSGWKYSDYKKYRLSNFRRNSLFKQTIHFSNIDYPRLHAAIFYVTNEKRAKYGLKFLSFARQLAVAAYHHSRSMAKKGYFSHNNPYVSSRRRPAQRCKLAGISNPKIAENIASSFAIKYRAGRSVYSRGRGKFSYSPQGPVLKNHSYLSFADAVVTQWMNSPGHRRNILSRKALQLGCGVYFYWKKNKWPMFMGTQNFQWFYKIRPGSAIDKGPRVHNSGDPDDSNDKDGKNPPDPKDNKGKNEPDDDKKNKDNDYNGDDSIGEEEE